MWGGRFSKTLDERALRYTTSLPVDRRLFEWDVLGSIAHARMLGRQNIIAHADAEALVAGLAGLLRNPPRLDGPFEDIHSLVESTLGERVGEPAGRLHTARSRNDQVATDTRLFVRAALVEGVAGIAELQSALLQAAEGVGQSIMPGYTHLQRAQPVLLGHHFLAYVDMLERDGGRMADAYVRADVLPLGAGALAGSPYPLDRAYVADLLGFGSLSGNSLDAVADRDFLVEHLAALAIVAMHLSRLAEELVLWSTTEFGFVALDESFTTGSSIMPHKRNPDVAELLRGKTGRVYGALISLLVMLKGLPMSYNRDLQEDKSPYFDAVDVVRDGLALAAAMLQGATWRTERLAHAAADPLIAATDLADHLTRRGLPFRQAHEIVGQIVQAAEAGQRRLDDFSVAELQTFSPLFDGSAAGLQAGDVVAARDVLGGTAPSQVAHQLDSARERLQTTRAWIAAHAQRLPTLESVTRPRS
ncbi:MAG: argininosuccinate lyase [Chloroflexi bacterium]|nr:argininosuccinate lyase [Chloroflexota bacterium]